MDIVIIAQIHGGKWEMTHAIVIEYSKDYSNIWPLKEIDKKDSAGLNLWSIELLVWCSIEENAGFSESYVFPYWRWS